MNYFIRVVLSLFIGVPILSGCATPIPPVEMVPTVVTPPPSFRDVSISIAAVTGGMETKSWDVSRIGNAEFKQALIETLQKAGAKVSADGEVSTYGLTSEIASQNIAGHFDNTVTLLVHYTLKNPRGERIWAENILSEKELSAKDVFYGQERIRKLQTSAIQSNFAILIDKLSNAIDTDRRHTFKSE